MDAFEKSTVRTMHCSVSDADQSWFPSNEEWLDRPKNGVVYGIDVVQRVASTVEGRMKSSNIFLV